MLRMYINRTTSFHSEYTSRLNMHETDVLNAFMSIFDDVLGSFFDIIEFRLLQNS